jgi:chorismate dehydratase
MIFAKIDFINLLPFYIFLKQNITSTQTKQIINYKKSYPSHINKKFKNRQIDAAFISSIVSRNCKCLDAGIVAKGEVLSVLSVGNETYKKDYQSDTSNALAKILSLNGEVLIGDKALYHYHNAVDRDFQDLAKVWNDKHKLPFVFARLCYNKHQKKLEKLSKRFVKSKVFIPQYILENYAKRSRLSKNQIKHYLTKISYKIEQKEKMALKKFFTLAHTQRKENANL